MNTYDIAIMTNQQGAPEALRLAEILEGDYCPDWFYEQGVDEAAAELRRLHAENTTLQQGYDAARLEIDHLRGATKMVEPAQPVAWLVYLPSIDTQHLYYSQEDMGYVDDVTNHADAEVTPLYEMAAPKAEVAPSGEYPPLPTPDSYLFQHEETGVTQYVDSQQVEWGFENNNPRLQRIGGAFTEAQMRAYVDADRAMRAQAAPAAVASPLTKLQRKAIAVCFTSDKVSVSEVQRKLSISYADAQTLCQSIVDLGLTDELELAPSLKQRGAPAPQAAPVAQGDALPREEFAWMVVQEACETEPADEDDPECIRILRRDLKSAVLAAFLREDAARMDKEGDQHG